MKVKEILNLIDGGENTTIEFKRKVPSPEKLAKEASAMANTKGGIIFIGVEDNGKIVGVQSEKSEMDLVDRALSFQIDPPVEYTFEILDISGKDLVIISIKESDNKPHKVMLYDEETQKHFKRAYIRVGEKSVMASGEMSKIMSYQNSHDKRSLKVMIGDREKRLFGYLEKYERITVLEFAKLVNVSRRRAERTLIILVRAGLIKIYYDSQKDYFSLV